jgi:hypothetical protein
MIDLGVELIPVTGLLLNDELSLPALRSEYTIKFKNMLRN